MQLMTFIKQIFHRGRHSRYHCRDETKPSFFFSLCLYFLSLDE